MKIPLCNVILPAESINEAKYALAEGWISGTGPAVTMFEKMLAAKVGLKYALAVTNGTHALELALQALVVNIGDEVIVPALTFVSPAAAVRQVGATPIFADVDEETWTVDPHEVQRVATIKTRAVIAVDLLGHPADYEAIKFALNFRTDVDVWLIEDAAEAHGAFYHRLVKQPVGSMADISTFSFHANKTITTGEGGAVLTDNPRIMDRLRLIANHGMFPERRYWHEVVGSNYRMNNVTAAIGVGQMQNWDKLVSARNLTAFEYDDRLSWTFENTDLRRRPVAEWASEACMLYTVTHPNRDKIVERLRRKGIDARPMWTALPDLPLYRDSVRGEYPVARRIAREGFFLPTWAGMPEQMIDYVAAELKQAIGIGVKA